jgi:hypothetical protein
MDRSFRLRSPSRFPGLPLRSCGKPFALLALVILAGCGGEAKSTVQTVTGRGFAFEAPAGWVVSRERGLTAASSGDVDRVEVRIFPLAKRYHPVRFDAVTGELDTIAARLARQLSGRLVARETVQVAGLDARSYRIDYRDRTQELTFVLVGRREYQLLCRRPAGDEPGEACELLVASFTLR